MSDKVGLLHTYSALARHAAHRHSIVAQNIANADTPDYKAQDIKSFAEIMQETGRRAEDVTTPLLDQHTFTVKSGGSIDGNTVTLETEMFKQADIAGQHALATTVYKKAMRMLSMTLGRNA